MNHWKETAIRLLPVWILIFCILQPLLDVAAYWQETLEYKSILTTLLRMSTIVVTAILGFWLTDRKRIYFAAAGVMALFAVVRSAALMQAGYTFQLEDIQHFKSNHDIGFMMYCSYGNAERLASRPSL